MYFRVHEYVQKVEKLIFVEFFFHYHPALPPPTAAPGQLQTYLNVCCLPIADVQVFQIAYYDSKPSGTRGCVRSDRRRDQRRSAKQRNKNAPTIQATVGAPPSDSFNNGKPSAPKHKPGIAQIFCCHAPTSKTAQGRTARSSGLYARKARPTLRPNSIDKWYAQRKGRRTVQANARTIVIRYPLFFIDAYFLNGRSWPISVVRPLAG